MRWASPPLRVEAWRLRGQVVQPNVREKAQPAQNLFEDLAGNGLLAVSQHRVRPVVRRTLALQSDDPLHGPVDGLLGDLDDALAVHQNR